MVDRAASGEHRVPCRSRLCDARDVDWAVVLFIGGEAILLAIAVGIILDRGRQLDAIRDLTAQDAATDDVAARVRRLQERLAASEFELDQQVRNASYLADLMGVGILRLDDSLRIELANTAAHLLLGRAPGSIVGRSTMEAFVDARVEGVVAAARDSGAGSGEFRVRGSDGPTLVVRARRSPVSGVWIVLEDVSELRRPPADPRRVRRQPLARAADAAVHDQPPRRDAGPGRRFRRPGRAGEDARPDHEDRGRDRPPRPDGQRASSTSPGSRAAGRSC
jgi:PAS domain-containing protein